MDFYFLFLFDFISTIVSYNAIKKCAKKVPGTSKTPLYPVKKTDDRPYKYYNITTYYKIRFKQMFNKYFIHW